MSAESKIVANLFDALEQMAIGSPDGLKFGHTYYRPDDHAKNRRDLEKMDTKELYVLVHGYFTKLVASAKYSADAAYVKRLLEIFRFTYDCMESLQKIAAAEKK